MFTCNRILDIYITYIVLIKCNSLCDCWYHNLIIEFRKIGKYKVVILCYWKKSLDIRGMKIQVIDGFKTPLGLQVRYVTERSNLWYILISNNVCLSKTTVLFGL